MLPRDEVLLELAERVARQLTTAGESLVTAESCTGGWISKALTDIPGSSSWFLEGFVTYSNEAKHRTLNVPWSIVERDGAVSETVAVAMAKGALRRSGASHAVSVTGIAGPGGAVPGKPVGTVWLCWAKRNGRSIETTVALKRFSGDRESVRRKTVHAALLGLLHRGVAKKKVMASRPRTEKRRSIQY